MSYKVANEILTPRPLPSPPVGAHPTYAAAGSVRDYFLKNSYNQLTVDTIFTDWVTVNVTESTAAQGVSGMNTCCNLEDALLGALAQVDSAIDFTALDSDNNGFVDAITVCSASGWMYGLILYLVKKKRVLPRRGRSCKSFGRLKGVKFVDHELLARDMEGSCVLYRCGFSFNGRASPSVESYVTREYLTLEQDSSIYCPEDPGTRLTEQWGLEYG